MGDGSKGGYIEPVNPEEWDQLTAKEGEYILSQEEVARIWHAAMTDWLRDRQKGYRKPQE
jgi:hypothetical protein